MHLLSKNGRGAFLNFLRNLTPQVLLMTVGFFLYFKWKSDNNIFDIILAACVVMVVLMSVIANMDDILENAFSQSKVIASHIEHVKQDEPFILKRIGKSLSYIFQEKPITLVELTITFFVIYIAIIAVLYTSILAVAKTFE